jgi:hypothetical protein
MLWWLYEIFSSARFLTISGDQGFWKSKRVYEFVLPLLLTSAVFVAYIYCNGAFVPNFVDTITRNTFDFMVFVVPFHLAALGAFATFDRPILDQPLKGTKAEIRVWSNEDQKYFYKTLNLRQYVSLLFGYLCTLGIVFITSYIFASTVNIPIILGENAATMNDVFVFLVVFFVSHYSFLSIYSITFLFDKVNEIGS